MGRYLVNYPVSLEGLIVAYQDIPVRLGVPFFGAEIILQHSFRRTDDTTGVVGIEYQVNGTPRGVVYTVLGAGETSATSGISEAVAWQDVVEIIVREKVGPITGMNLNGYVQMRYSDVQADPEFGDLTTLTRVKTFLGLTDVTFDTYLAQLITDVSVRMQRWMDRDIHGAVVVNEFHDSAGLTDIALWQHPVKSVEAVRVYGTVQDTDSYRFEAETGILRRLSGKYPVGWPMGLDAVAVDYTSGYEFVPNDLQLAADQQVAWESGLSKVMAAGGRLGLSGTVLPEGGTSEYVPNTQGARGWVPAVLQTMARYKRLPEAA